MKQMPYDSRQPELSFVLGGTAEHSDDVVAEMLRLFRGDKRRVMRQREQGYRVLHAGPITKTDLTKHLQGHVSLAYSAVSMRKRHLSRGARPVQGSRPVRLPVIGRG